MSSRQRGRARNNRNNHNNHFLPRYRRLLNRARNLLRRRNGWAGADPNADDLSSNASDNTPNLGNLQPIVLPQPAVPNNVFVQHQHAQADPNNNNNNEPNNNNYHTPPTSPNRTPPPAPLGGGRRNLINPSADEDAISDERYRRRLEDRLRRGDDAISGRERVIFLNTIDDNYDTGLVDQSGGSINDDGGGLEGSNITSNDITQDDMDVDSTEVDDKHVVADNGREDEDMLQVQSQHGDGGSSNGSMEEGQ